MEQVLMQNCGDGYRRADCRSAGVVIAKAASHTINGFEEDGYTFSNGGATGATTVTLPAATSGRQVRVLKVNAQNVLIKATGGAKINGGTANKVYKNVTGSETSASCTLLADGTDWHVIAEKGTWANDNS